MKSFRFFLITLISLSSIVAAAQDKLVAIKSSKEKSAKPVKAFSIIEKGPLLTKATFRKDDKAAGNVIEIEALNVSGGSVSLGNYSSGKSPVKPGAEISEINSIIGDYASTRNISKSGRGVVTQLLDVNYPFRARINVSEQIFEFEITEPGFWKISVAVSQ